MKLYKAQLGSPKNRRLMKVLQEQGNKQLVQKMELDALADRKLPAGKQQFRQTPFAGPLRDDQLDWAIGKLIQYSVRLPSDPPAVP